MLPNIVRAAATFTIDGRAPGGVSPLPSHESDVAVFRIDDPKLAIGSKIGVALKANVPSALGPRAPAANTSFAISTDQVVTIKDATLVEGANGYYLEVVCNDGAAPEGHRYSYVGEGYSELSERCQLSDEAISRIHFTPAVKKTYITAGKTGFRVFGEFARGAYSITIDGGATSVDGGVVLAPFSRSFSVAARKPQLSFVGSGRYLPRTAWTNLGIKHLNVDEVNLAVRQVPPENLVFYLGNEQSDSADERTSNLILDKNLPVHGDADAPTTTWLDVASILPATTRGVLELTVTGDGVAATSRLLLTNLSLVAKKTSPPHAPWQQQVQVWALDMDSADSLDGVEVSLVRKSGKVVAHCTTSGDKGCALDATNPNDPDSAEPFALIARKGDDLTYIRYSDLRADVTESTTSGTPYVIDTPYRATMYSDRGVYRPGDTVHVSAIVRDAHDRAPATPLPVDVTVIDPRAKVVRKLALKTNASGMLSLDHALPVFADTGHWRVALAVADKPLASYDVQVEEFVPERMKVTLAPQGPRPARRAAAHGRRLRAIPVRRQRGQQRRQPVVHVGAERVHAAGEHRFHVRRAAARQAGQPRRPDERGARREGHGDDRVPRRQDGAHPDRDDHRDRVGARGRQWPRDSRDLDRDDRIPRSSISASRPARPWPNRACGSASTASSSTGRASRSPPRSRSRSSSFTSRPITATATTTTAARTPTIATCGACPKAS